MSPCHPHDGLDGSCLSPHRQRGVTRCHLSFPHAFLPSGATRRKPGRELGATCLCCPLADQAAKGAGGRSLFLRINLSEEGRLNPMALSGGPRGRTAQNSCVVGAGYAATLCSSNVTAVTVRSR